MKKKMTILGVLLLAVVVTAYSVSGTYAKYISTIGGTDTARVAKWSFNSDEGINLFAESYKNGAVQSLGNDNVVAPGTNGEYSFALSTDELISEVKYKLSVNIDGTNNAKIEMTDNSEIDVIASADVELFELINSKMYYSPVKFYLSDGTDSVTSIDNISDNAWTTLDDVIDTLETYYSGFATEGQNPTGAALANANKVFTIYWKWDFTEIPELTENNADEVALAKIISKYDTKLGQAATTTPENYMVTVQVEFIAEQLAN